MSFTLPLSSLTSIQRNLISKTCIISKPKTLYDDQPVKVVCFSTSTKNDTVSMPLGVWNKFLDKIPNKRSRYPTTKRLVDIDRMSVLKTPLVQKPFSFFKTLFTAQTDPKKYRDQKVVYKKAMKHLKKWGTCFLALPTGFGKTTMGIELARKLGKKTVVLCHFDIVNERWISDIKNFTDAKVVKLTGKKKITDYPDVDIFVVGVLKASKFSREETREIGTVIFDEAHVTTVTAFTTTLLKFTPRYLIGLSATPKRADGLHSLLKMYFHKFIERKEVKEFTVIKWTTDYKPIIEYKMVKGQQVLDWNAVVNSLAYDPYRQQEIVNIISKRCKEVQQARKDGNEDRIMVLSDRKEQCKAIHEMLVEEGIDAEILIGTKKKWNKTAKVLVAGTKKAGVGFDDPTLTVLILASDSKSVEQFEGRIRTSNNTIYDIVDDFVTLERHWKMREKWYKQRGATIVNGGKKRIARAVGDVPLKRLM